MKHLITLTLRNGKTRKCQTEDYARAEMAWQSAGHLLEAGACIHAAWTRDGVNYCEIEE